MENYGFLFNARATLIFSHKFQFWIARILHSYAKFRVSSAHFYLPIKNSRRACMKRCGSVDLNLNTNCLQFLLFWRRTPGYWEAFEWACCTCSGPESQSQLQGVAFKLHIELWHSDSNAAEPNRWQIGSATCRLQQAVPVCSLQFAREAQFIGQICKRNELQLNASEMSASARSVAGGMPEECHKHGLRAHSESS